MIVFIEAQPKGKPEGSPIKGYVIEDPEDNLLRESMTQQQAILWAKDNKHTPHIARVRHLNDKKKPDHWRAI